MNFFSRFEQQTISS